MILDHVGIAVRSIEEAAGRYAAFGIQISERYEAPADAVRVAFMPAGGVDLELLEPSGDGPVAAFLDARGPGLHHIAFRVRDIHQAIADAVRAGHRPLDAVPRRGARGHLIAFLHPQAAGGVLMEFVQE